MFYLLYKKFTIHLKREIGWKIFSHHLEKNVKIHTDFNTGITRELLSTYLSVLFMNVKHPKFMHLNLRATLDITDHFSTQSGDS